MQSRATGIADHIMPYGDWLSLLLSTPRDCGSQVYSFVFRFALLHCLNDPQKTKQKWETIIIIIIIIMIVIIIIIINKAIGH